MKMVVSNISDLPAAATALLGEHKTSRIFALYGEMGAGKTTFIRELCRELGSADNVVSPTFTLVNQYLDDKGEPMYHFDFYRINSLSEVFDFGIEEYLTGESYCFLEWPEKIEPFLPEGTVIVRITVEPDGSRTIES